MKTVEEFARRLKYVQSLHADFPIETISILGSFQQVTLLFENSVNTMLMASGLNTSLWKALMMMYSNPDKSMYPSDLSDVCIQSRPQMTRISDELVAAGWVYRESDPVDRRKISLRLTTEGIELVQGMLPKVTAFYLTLLSPLSAEEQDTLHKLLLKLGQSPKSDCSEFLTSQK